MNDSQLPSTSAEVELSAHIFAVSAGLVGVCLTVIGLFRVVVRSQHIDSIADNLLAIDDALFFLAACFLAYLALRTAPSEALEGIGSVWAKA